MWCLTEYLQETRYKGIMCMWLSKCRFFHNEGSMMFFENCYWHGS